MLTEIQVLRDLTHEIYECNQPFTSRTAAHAFLTRPVLGGLFPGGKDLSAEEQHRLDTAIGTLTTAGLILEMQPGSLPAYGDGDVYYAPEGYSQRPGWPDRVAPGSIFVPGWCRLQSARQRAWQDDYTKAPTVVCGSLSWTLPPAEEIQSEYRSVAALIGLFMGEKFPADRDPPSREFIVSGQGFRLDRAVDAIIGTLERSEKLAAQRQDRLNRIEQYLNSHPAPLAEDLRHLLTQQDQ